MRDNKKHLQFKLHKHDKNWDLWQKSITMYIITQVILAFWSLLAYDLLVDRRTIDVIITKFFPMPF